MTASAGTGCGSQTIDKELANKLHDHSDDRARGFYLLRKRQALAKMLASTFLQLGLAGTCANTYPEARFPPLAMVILG
jgi:hypothetical protein